MRLSTIVCFCVCLGVPAIARAQAEVGPEGSLSTSFAYTFGFSDKIVETNGMQLTNFKTQHHILQLGVDYGLPIEGLGIDVALPLVGVKWDDSSNPHFPTQGEWDDGSMHFALTDLRAGLRYQVLENPFVLTLSAAGSVPVSDYPTYGLTAPGRGLKAGHFGLAASKFISRLFVYGAYEFSLVEKADDIPELEEYGQNYSTANILLGYFVLDRLEVHGAFDLRRAHGGLDFEDYFVLPMEVQENHDVILRENVVQAGVGAGYSLTDSFGVGADARFFLGGNNTRNTTLIGLSAYYQVL